MPYRQRDHRDLRAYSIEDYQLSVGGGRPRAEAGPVDTPMNKADLGAAEKEFPFIDILGVSKTQTKPGANHDRTSNDSGNRRTFRCLPNLGSASL
jgi:hypothetical protein